MRKTWVVCLIGLMGSGLWGWTLPAQAEMARYDVDPEHSMIEFRVAHMVISKTTGHFKDYSGVQDRGPLYCRGRFDAARRHETHHPGREF